MKVTFFLDCFPTTSETFVLNQITGLIDLGYEVEIVSVAKPADYAAHAAIEDYQLLKRVTYLLEPEPTAALSRFAKRVWKLFKCIGYKEVRHALQQGNFGTVNRNLLFSYVVANQQERKSGPLVSDVVVAHFGPTAVMANNLIRAGVIKGPLVAFFHGYDVSNHQLMSDYAADYLTLFSDAALILPISQYWFDKLLSMGCPAEKLRLHRMGVATEQFAMAPQTPAPVDNTLSESTLQLLSVARLTEKKGLGDMLTALALLKQQGVKFQYSIIGNGPKRKELLTQIKDLDLTTEVKLLGALAQADVITKLHQCDVFALPSVTALNGDSEGIPVSLMEAMAMGKICLSTRHTGIPELITDGENGFLVDERDPVAICQKLRFIAEHLPNLDTLVNNARQKVADLHDIKSLNQQLVNLLLTIVSDRMS